MKTKCTGSKQPTVARIIGGVAFAMCPVCNAKFPRLQVGDVAPIHGQTLYICQE